MAGRVSRDKGQRGEREWAEWLTRQGFQARRGCQHAGGPDSPDVVGGIPKTHAEVKRTERLFLERAIQQAVKDAPDGSVPYVAYRRNRGEWLVTLRARDLVLFGFLLAESAAELQHAAPPPAEG